MALGSDVSRFVHGCGIPSVRKRVCVRRVGDGEVKEGKGFSESFVRVV